METQAKYKVKNDLQLVPYNLEAATVEALKSKYLDVTIPPDDRAAYSMVMSGLRECREIRLAVDAWHKEKKELIVRAGKHYDTERRRVHALVEPVEEHLAAVRKVEDDRKEAITAEAVRIERERVEKVRAKINAMSLTLIDTQGKTAAQIQDMIAALVITPILVEDYQEFYTEAKKTIDETISILIKASDNRLNWEQEQAAAKAEAIRLEKIRKEQEAEAKRIKAERDAIEAEKKALEDAKRAEKERQERAEFERKVKEEAKAMAEVEAREKVEREAKLKAEAEEKERAEKARQDALMPDKKKIITYVNGLLDHPRPEIKEQSAAILFESAISAIDKWGKKLINQAKAL